MIIPMTGGAYKVFTSENKYIGAFHSKELAELINSKGRTLTNKELITFAKKHGKLARRKKI